MVDLKTQIEDTREKLNLLIEKNQLIADNAEILRISILLDKLINQYMYIEKVDIK